MTDEDINYSDIPPLTDEQLASMQPLHEALPGLVPQQTRVTISFDADVLKWFEQQAQNAGGRSYQSLMNIALREYIERQKITNKKSRRRARPQELATVK
jgi:uncharacterized protein (DUF4415 family)